MENNNTNETEEKIIYDSAKEPEHKNNNTEEASETAAVSKKMKYYLIAATALLIAAVTVIVLFCSKDESENADVSSTKATRTQTVDSAEDKNKKEQSEAKSEKTESKSGALSNAVSNAASEAKVESSSESSSTEEETYTPLFMYFVTKSDEGYDDYMKAVKELEEEYKGRVEFQITDIDENPEAKDNFPVEGNTPLLIMNNSKNEICAFGFSCGDKQKLKEYIETAF